LEGTIQPLLAHLNINKRFLKALNKYFIGLYEERNQIEAESEGEEDAEEESSGEGKRIKNEESEVNLRRRLQSKLLTNNFH